MIGSEKLRGRVICLMDEGRLTLFTPEGCKRLKIGYYPEWQKNLLYMGFATRAEAARCRQWLINNGFTTAYKYNEDSGCPNPRPAKRITNCQWELKIHRPSIDLVKLAIKKDQGRADG